MTQDAQNALLITGCVVGGVALVAGGVALGFAISDHKKIKEAEKAAAGTALAACAAPALTANAATPYIQYNPVALKYGCSGTQIDGNMLAALQKNADELAKLRQQVAAQQ